MSRHDVDSPDYQCFSAGGDYRTTPEEREIERLEKKVRELEARLASPSYVSCRLCGNPVDNICESCGTDPAQDP